MAEFDKRKTDSLFVQEVARRDEQHKQNTARFDDMERRLKGIEQLRPVVEDARGLLASINKKIDAFNPEIFNQIVVEHESRIAVRKWLARCFSSGTRIFGTLAAIATVLAFLTASFGWILDHFRR